MEQSEIYKQVSLFSLIYEKKQITKPIRLIEFFAGIGAQYKALKQITSKVEHYKICEWAYNSIVSYNAIHIKDFKDYSSGKSREEMVEKIKGISTNYNEPLNEKQLNSKPIEWIKNAFNNIVATNNLVNIMQVHGKDLEIVDTDKYEYILTYSFPCQDLSLAGKRKGMATSQAEGGTRSGLLWEVERILDELARERELPQILVMENVPEVIGKGNIENFQKWERKLSELGYQNYVEIMNGKEYGIPQNRRRCFMVSILGEYSYEFPIKVALKYHLKDLLESQVDEKYYLSKKMIDYIAADNDKWTGNNGKAIVNKEIGCTLNTAPGQRRCDASNYVCDELPENTDIKKIDKKLKSEMCEKLIQEGKVQENDVIRHSYTNSRIKGEMKDIQQNNMCPTLDTRCDCLGVVTKSGEEGLKIRDATKKGYRVADHGDGIDISARKGHRGTVQNGLIQTIKTEIDVGVCVREETQDIKKLRIRKLTPKECIRLMGFQSEDFNAMREAGMSDNGIYHMAGDSIIVTCLMAIFSTMINDDYEHIELINEYTKTLIEEK